MYTKEELVTKILKCHRVTVHDAPEGLIGRLIAAIAQAEKEGRGKVNLSDFEIQFVTVDPGMRGSFEIAVMQHEGDDTPFLSDYTKWLPVDDEGTPIHIYDCWVVVNEMVKIAQGVKQAA